jgi:uncharacterized membrane protein
MSTLAVWRFDTSDGAERGGQALQHLDPPGASERSSYDAALVSWAPGKSKPTTSPVPLEHADAALGETFWGVLFGVIFFSPLLDAAVASATGDTADGLAVCGLDATFVHRMRDVVTPGTSALFVVGDALLIDRVNDALRRDGPVTAPYTTLHPVLDSSVRQVGAS